MRTLFFVATLLPCLFLETVAEAHIRLTSPTARFVQDDNGLKTGPCGSGSATGIVTPLVPGQSLTVTWKESVSHAGHYRIALSAKESDFVEPTDLTIPSTLPAWDLVDGIQDKTGTQTYTQAVQIPAKECPACVLQLLQVMSAGTDGTNTGSFSGVYHACADVSISSAAGDASVVSDVAVILDVRTDLATRDSADGRGQVSDTVTASGGSAGTGGTPGTGGAGGSSSSGTTGAAGNGTGGLASATGGMTGSAGASSGGMSSTAGNGAGGKGTGGMTTTTGGGGNGSGGTTVASNTGNGAGGATVASGGGSQAGSGGSPGSGGNSMSPTGTTSNGCGCHLGSSSPDESPTLLALMALLLALGASRLRRRSSAFSRPQGHTAGPCAPGPVLQERAGGKSRR